MLLAKQTNSSLLSRVIAPGATLWGPVTSLYGEVSPAELWRIFSDEYLPTQEAPWGRFGLRGMQTSNDGQGTEHLL